jgi:hypothetical protein
MSKNKKGIERKEYPKLVRNKDGKKIRVMNEAEEAKVLGKEIKKEEKKEAGSKGWGA